MIAVIEMIVMIIHSHSGDVVLVRHRTGCRLAVRLVKSSFPGHNERQGVIDGAAGVRMCTAGASESRGCHTNARAEPRRCQSPRG